jgi:hypothetical protein
MLRYHLLSLVFWFQNLCHFILISCFLMCYYSIGRLYTVRSFPQASLVKCLDLIQPWWQTPFIHRSLYLHRQAPWLSFWATIGPHLRYLHLRMSKLFCDSPSLNTIIFPLMRPLELAVDRIQSIAFLNQIIERGKDALEYTDIWRKLLLQGTGEATAGTLSGGHPYSHAVLWRCRRNFLQSN